MLDVASCRLVQRARGRDFLTHVIAYGTVEDLAAIEDIIGGDDFGEVLNNTPPGIFDKRSGFTGTINGGRRTIQPFRRILNFYRNKLLNQP